MLKAAGALGVDGTVLAPGNDGPGGVIHATGAVVTLDATANLDASGSKGGGEVLVGGGRHGQDPRIDNAQRTVVANGARVSADATNRGNGGSVVIWADQTTRFAGSIQARGGQIGGDGGQVEVSGKRVLDFRGQVDLSAAHGRTGALLLDPSSITIGAVADVDGNSTPGDDVSGDIDSSDFGTAASMITAANVSALLNTVDLSLAATGDILVSQPITKTTGSATTLTLYAGNKLDIHSPISGAPGSPLNLSLESEGAMSTTAAITTFGGSVSMIAGFGMAGGITLNGDINAGTGTVTMAAHAGETQPSGAITASSLTASGSLGGLTLNGANNVGIARLSGGGGGGVSFNNVAASYFLGGSGSNGLTVTGTGSVTVDQVLNFTSIDISADNGITLAADLTSSGSLNLTTVNHQIDQSAGKITAIQTDVNAGSGDIALTSMTNNTLLVSLAGGHITMQNSGQLIVTALTSGLDKNVFLQAGGALTLPEGAIDTGAGQLSLTNGSGSMTTPGALTGSDVLLNSQGDLILAHPVTSNGASTLTLSSGGTLSVQAAVEGHGINMDATTGIDILAPVHATSGLTVTSNGANNLMQVKKSVTSDGTMNLTLTGGLSVINNGILGVGMTAYTGQTIAAKFVEVLSSGGGVTAIHNLDGAQSITTSGVNASGEGLVVADTSASLGAGAQIASNGITQTITVNDADYVRVFSNGGGSPARINHHGAGNQTILAQGIYSQNRIEVGAGGATSGTLIYSDTGSQSITAGQAGQSGTLVLAGGASGQSVSVYTPANQTIQAGSGGIQLTGGSTANNYVGINQQGPGGTQTITTGGPITVDSGSPSGDGNYTEIKAVGTGGQSITMGGGTMTVQAGNGGSNNKALIKATNGNQLVTGAGGIVIRGGASGGGLAQGNSADLQLIGGTSIGNQTISVGSDGILIEGGGGTGSDTDNSAFLSYGGTGSQSITISGGGHLTINGGSSPWQAIGTGHGSRASIDAGTAGGATQSIMLDGGDIVLNGGSNGSRNWAMIYSDQSGASQTISGAGNIHLKGGPSGGVDTEGNRATIQTGGSQSISATNQITLTGGDGGTENFAEMVLNGTSPVNQTISANRIVMTGGLAGGGLGTGNTAWITSFGSQVINVGSGGMSMTGGSGPLTDNAVEISQLLLGGSQTINVAGGALVSMQGGTSLATTVGTSHGSYASIYSKGASQTINFPSGGTLDMLGGSAGQRNFANISIDNGNQSITGSPAILVRGGNGGGVPGEGNGAYITANHGNQAVNASSITLAGGISGTENLVQLRQGNTTTGLGGTHVDIDWHRCRHQRRRWHQ